MADSTNKHIMTIPGRHATLVGNANQTGDADTGFNHVYGPGKVTRHLAETYLTEWGTQLKDKLNYSDAEILTFYDQMIGNKDVFEKMHDVGYLKTVQKGQRSVSSSWSNIGSSFGTVDDLNQDPHFVNIHHRELFQKRYASFYGRLFEKASMQEMSYDLNLFNLEQMYPNLFGFWKKINLI